MTLSKKILLSIPSILGFSYLLTFLFPKESQWLVPSMKAYYIQIGIMYILTILQVTLLIKKLWSFKGLEKTEKTEWTWFLVLFNSLTAIIFIWRVVDDLEKINNEKS